MNVIARLEYELAYYDSTVHRFNHYTTKDTPLSFWEELFRLLNSFMVLVLGFHNISTTLLEPSLNLQPLRYICNRKSWRAERNRVDMPAGSPNSQHVSHSSNTILNRRVIHIIQYSTWGCYPAPFLLNKAKGFTLGEQYHFALNILKKKKRMSKPWEKPRISNIDFQSSQSFLTLKIGAMQSSSHYLLTRVCAVLNSVVNEIVVSGNRGQCSKLRRMPGSSRKLISK